MRLYLFAVVGLAACGDVTARHLPDAPNAPIDALPDGPVDGAVDAAPRPCTFVASTSTSQTVLSYTLSGGAFQSFGCAPIDPTYWLSGSGMFLRVTFVDPQARPSIRVWGMNTDDTASMMVNGAAYTLSATSASLAPKVVCGQSPGPDGVAFVGGSLTGANTPSQGNYSYQDVTIEQTAVTSIQLTGLTGQGWGIAGASIGNCAPTP
jgi:hypothetical protein